MAQAHRLAPFLLGQMIIEGDKSNNDLYIIYLEELHRPGKRDTKRLGDIAELTFDLKSASLGITASKPFGDRRPYDYLVESGRRLLRVQVKSVFAKNTRVHRSGFQVSVSQHREGGRATYTADQIDFIAAFVALQEAWYVIPVEALSSRKSVRLYPGGKKRIHAGLFENFREAWRLLKGASE
jgi:hypothetical protein